MAYTIGISSGIWAVAKSEGYAGISRKIYTSILYGVNFVQLDLERLVEFLEPDLEKKMEKIKEGGYSFGIHGECSAFGSPVPLDSSDKNEYMLSHKAVERHIKEAAKYGAKYVLFHSSESTPFALATRDLKHMVLVDPWGNSMNNFLEKNPKILDWAIKNKFISQNALHDTDPETSIKDHVKNSIKKLKRDKPDIDINELKKIEEDFEIEIIEYKKNQLKDTVVSGGTMYTPDRIAYALIAKYMEMQNHALWKSFVGNKKFEDVVNDESIWVPAVTAMYVAGHFDDKNKYSNLKKLTEKNKLDIIFETPMPPQPGYEQYMRLPRLIQIYKMIEYINSDYIGLAVDFEHLMTSNLDPKKEIEALPNKAGKKVKVLHLGAPAPYAGAHMGIEIGSDAQRYLYDRIWELRQKEFKDGIIIFERAAEEGIKTSILSLRMIKKFLEQDISPKELPLEFYGLEQNGAELRRQELAIRQHALDPLKGTLSVPEEEYGFFSTEAQKKGKLKEWSEGEYK